MLMAIAQRSRENDSAAIGTYKAKRVCIAFLIKLFSKKFVQMTTRRGANGSPTTGLMTEEKIRGALAGVFATSVSIGLNVLGVTTMGLSAPVSAFIFYYLFGGFVAYGADVLVAKQKFTNHPRTPEGKPAVPVPYSDLKTRFKWLVGSLYSRHFFRFVVAILIETMTGVAMLEAVIQWMNQSHFYMDHEVLRNAIMAVIIAGANFILFGAVLRFDWAYNESENQLLNIMVLMWLALVLIIFAIGSRFNNKVHPDASSSSPTEEEEEKGHSIIKTIPM